MNYYRTLSQQLEDIRSAIKHFPESVDLYNLRGTLGMVVQDLDILTKLRRPDVYTLQKLESLGDEPMVRVTMQFELPAYEAEELVRKLWLEMEYTPVSDETTAAPPIPAEPPEQPPAPPV